MGSIENVFGILKEPLNLAHVEDRRAQSILLKDEKDYLSAIECHQKAHAYLRTTYLRLLAQERNEVELVNPALMDSIYSQMEYHLCQQSVLLNKQKIAITELKRQPYIATLREKATELAFLSSLPKESRLRQQLSHQESLLQSLKEHLSQPTGPEIEDDKHTASGRKKPKETKETLEELQNLNDQLKVLVNELVDENIKLKKQLELSKPANGSATPTFPYTPLTDSTNSTNNHIYSLPKALNLPPLAQPPEFSIDVSLEYDSDQNI